MRTLDELVNNSDPALPLIEQWMKSSDNHCEFLPPSEENADVLLGLQVTTRSPMGAIAYESGGLLIDFGWLRILGSGHPKLARNILAWNKNKSSGYMLVADDVVGGFFAANGGAFGQDLGTIYYWAPDTLEWEPLGIGYSDFLRWAFTSQLAKFYSNLRWPGWESDIQSLNADQCFTFYPFLWTEEGSVQASTRKAICVAEQYALNTDLAFQLNAKGLS